MAVVADNAAFLNFQAGIPQNAPEKAMSGVVEVNLAQEREVGIIQKQKKCYILT